MRYMKDWIDQLERNHELSDEQLVALITMEEDAYRKACAVLDLEPEETIDPAEPDACEAYLAERAAAVRARTYGKDVYIRGLIEFTNYCKNDCYYCGIRRGNPCAERYRLTKEEILECCHAGYGLGFRTFVLQGGEDPYFTESRVAELVQSIKAAYPDCAVTLSVGEKSRETYQAWFDAGADRYLLRHETANRDLYGQLHPEELSLENRMRCLKDLKEIGYQVGCGFMVGSPFQKPEMMVEDLRYIQRLQPQMVGIGPFIPHKDTPFRDKEAGTARMTLRLLAIIRLMLPQVLLPATTALGTVQGDGRVRGMQYGANVVMPNLSPGSVRKKYALYDNKISTGEEAAESVALLKTSMAAIGYRVVTDRGDWKRGAV